MDMGQKIKFHREKLGMTLEDLGNKVGVGKSTVRKWETGMIANMRRDKISKIADALEISPAYLMGWTENPDPAYAETKIGKLEIFSAQAKEADDNIKSQVDNAIKEAGLDPDEIQRAIHLFEEYQKVPADVQSVIERLLKSSQSDS